MIWNKPNSSKDTVLSSWMGKFDAIYFGEDENNLGTGHFWNDFNRPYSMNHIIWMIWYHWFHMVWFIPYESFYMTSIDFERYWDGKRGRRNPTAAQSELILSKEQLYDMFQYILGIKRFEHQTLYQNCQVLIYLCMAYYIGPIWDGMYFATTWQTCFLLNYCIQVYTVIYRCCFHFVSQPNFESFDCFSSLKGLIW